MANSLLFNVQPYRKDEMEETLKSLPLYVDNEDIAREIWTLLYNEINHHNPGIASKDKAQAYHYMGTYMARKDQPKQHTGEVKMESVKFGEYIELPAPLPANIMPRLSNTSEIIKHQSSPWMGTPNEAPDHDPSKG
jgi:hypothetical protein